MGIKLKTKFQFINFVEIERKPKTKVWLCRNNRSSDELGVVKWYPGWRQYCYFPSCKAVYSKGCLDDISEFMGQL